ncbi:MAG: hypothetical protein H6818_13500 [Phycisphaerales bacterium]|nr:hypothetical protein [Phycisphaerales bacterium]MCB9862182.1 hypothetical protein [Phycisphaerales bacterium]
MATVVPGAVGLLDEKNTIRVTPTVSRDYQYRRAAVCFSFGRTYVVTRIICVVALAAAATSASAQSFNVDVGAPGTEPSADYAAAGLPGKWNTIMATHVTPFMTGPHPQAEHLFDLAGDPTNVVVHQFGGMDLNQKNDGLTAGDDAALMDDYRATHSTSLETCLYINGLAPGRYEVTTYAWMPVDNQMVSKVRFDFQSYIPLVGGAAWPGHHVEGVTFTRHIVTVTSGGSMTFIGMHVGVPSGGNTTLGAPLNGFQLRLLPEDAPADMDCDGFVNGRDIEGFVSALLDEEAYRSANPTCNIYHADMNNNGSVGMEDVAAFVSAVLAG